MQPFQPKDVKLDRQNMTKLIELLDNLLEKLGVEKKARDNMTKSIVGLCMKDPKLLPKLLMNLADKKNGSILKFLNTFAALAKQKDHKLETDFTLVLKFLLLSEKELKAEFKKDPLLLQKMQRELKELGDEVKELFPEKAKELDALINEVEKSLDKMEERLLKNQPLIEPGSSPEQKEAQAFFESLRGFSRFGGYPTAHMSVTNSAGISDDAELGVEKDLEGPLEWLTEHIFGETMAPMKGIAGDTLSEVAELNREHTAGANQDAGPEAEEEAAHIHKSPFAIGGTPTFRPPGSTTK